MSEDLVSIITPVYNAESFLQETIQSVKEQTYSHWELLLIDDGSTDASVAIAKQAMAADSRIRLLENEENSGAAVSRNRGIDAAKGRYIAFLDSDDIWYPKKLQKQISFMQKEDVVFSYASYDVMNHKGEMVSHFDIPKEELRYTDLLKTCSIGCLTAVLDVQQIGKKHMALLPARQDYSLWLKYLREGVVAKGLTERLAAYRIGADSLSSNKRSAAAYQWQVYREVEGLSMLKSIYYFVHYAIHGVLKYR